MAQLVFNALSGILSEEQLAKVQDVVYDSGVGEQLDKYRKAYEQEWFPTGTYSSTKFRMYNLEKEVVKLRGMLYANGLGKRERALNDFDVGTDERGHTILLPKTRLAELIIANTKDTRFKLNAVPDQEFEKINAELENAKKICNDLVEQNQTLIGESNFMFGRIGSMEKMIKDLKEELKSADEHIDYQDRMIQGLANRAGLIAEVTGSHIQIGNNNFSFGVDDVLEGKPIPVVIDDFKCKPTYSNSSDFSFGTVESDFVKNLTMEGIESNPGPAWSDELKVFSMRARKTRPTPTITVKHGNEILSLLPLLLEAF
uniref:NSP3 n=1 Tax=Rotavirus I TaxID=1637496 RepID=A0A1S6XXK4_9REOV|nr:NSP3 [Rotavirus I]